MAHHLYVFCRILLHRPGRSAPFVGHSRCLQGLWFFLICLSSLSFRSFEGCIQVRSACRNDSQEIFYAGRWQWLCPRFLKPLPPQLHTGWWACHRLVTFPLAVLLWRAGIWFWNFHICCYVFNSIFSWNLALI